MSIHTSEPRSEIAQVMATGSSQGTPPSPFISIIVPVYRVEQYLTRCLDSILAQSFSNFEILLINDGSPDNCGAICDEYSKIDSRVRTFHQNNAGVSTARNLGLDNARGEWLAFVDSDDWVETNWLSFFHNKSGGELDQDLVLYGRRKLNKFGILYEYTHLNATCEAKEFTNSKAFYMIALWSCFFKRKTIEKHQIRFSPNLRFAEDTEFLLKTFAASKNLSTISSILYNYYSHETSATKRMVFDFSRASQVLKSINGFLAFCKLHSLPDKQFAPTVLQSYRIFLRNYLYDSNPKPEDKPEFLLLYRETIENHLSFRNNLFFKLISIAWMPSLMAIRIAMKLKKSMHKVSLSQ